MLCCKYVDVLLVGKSSGALFLGKGRVLWEVKPKGYRMTVLVATVRGLYYQLLLEGEAK